MEVNICLCVDMPYKCMGGEQYAQLPHLQLQAGTLWCESGSNWCYEHGHPIFLVQLCQTERTVKCAVPPASEAMMGLLELFHVLH